MIYTYGIDYNNFVSELKKKEEEEGRRRRKNEYRFMKINTIVDNND